MRLSADARGRQGRTRHLRLPGQAGEVAPRVDRKEVVQRHLSTPPRAVSTRPGERLGGVESGKLQ